MRIAACLLAVLCAATYGFAQEVIEWSAQRRLTTEDFRGPIPANASTASMSFIHINALWECDGDRLVAKVEAAFDPLRSWFRRSRTSLERDVQLLEHEQLHFDIAEAVVRKIRAQFDRSKHACEESGGTEAFHQLIVDADRELGEEQQRFDRETGHGINARVQDQWKRRIKALLN